MIFARIRDIKHSMKVIDLAEDAEDAELALLFTFLDFFPLLLFYRTSNTMNRSYTVNIKTKKGKVMKMVKVCIPFPAANNDPFTFCVGTLFA